MNSYEINNDTLAILPLNEYKSKVIEKTKTFVVDLLWKFISGEIFRNKKFNRNITQSTNYNRRK